MVKIKLSDGTELYYKIIGQGPLIVLNHGYGSSHKSVKYVAEHLKDSFSCLLYDQRGQGDSDKTIGDSYDETLKMYTLDQLSDDCYDLLKQLNFIDNPEIGKFFMYGHSMGGMISLLYAIKYGESLKGLCVGSTTANGYDPEWSKMLSEYKNGSIQFTEETFRENAKLGFTENFIIKNPEYIDFVVEDKLKLPKDATIALLANIVNNYNIEFELSKLSLPVLILHGKEDSTINVEKGIKIHKLILNSELALFPDQKHEINKEIPETIAGMLKMFFLINKTKHKITLKKKPDTKGFDDTIQGIDMIMQQILTCFNDIEIKPFEENEIYFCNLVGDFTSYLNRLLDIYFENANSRQEQLKYKPDILYYRQVQGYLVFLLRYPDILRVQEHDEIQQTIKFLENKNYLIKTLYFDLAKEQTEVFENEEFKKELEKKMEQKEYKLP